MQQLEETVSSLLGQLMNTENDPISQEEDSLKMTPQMLQMIITAVVNGSQTSSEASKEKEVKDLPKLKEGTIRYRKDGRYEGRYMCDGMQKSVYARTQKDCINKLKKAIRERDKREESQKSYRNITLNDWFDKWINTFKTNIKEQSRTEITTRYNNYIKPVLGFRKIKTLTTLDLQECLNDIFYKSVRKRAYRELKAIFNKAQVTDIITKTPMLGVEDLTKKSAKKTKVLSQKEHKAFLTFLQKEREELRYVVELVSYTGLRLGEVCALELCDIDFKNKTITINKSMNKRTSEIGPPKTEQSNRTIPLMAPAEKSIREYIEIYEPENRLFNQFTSSNLSNSVRYYAKKYGLDGISIHSFRTYFVSLCATLGIDLKVRQKWAGHKDARITNDVYTRIQPSLELKSVQKFNENTI
ncbi:MAG: tyrosine-type recombinase/integrase [Candidatus Izemoplasma sp.]|nr:tyrosine-type recombinase/integrase [Candidatus Izemoplasma sp.]